MQYYQNGFVPGDPADSRELDVQDPLPELVELPSTVDVLIVGCGPAGLMLAAQLAQFSEVRTRIIEQKAGPLRMGQADGISGRSLEIFQALGFSERVLKEAYFLEAITFWKHDDDDHDRIVRTYKKPDGRTVFSEFPHVVLNQARVHDFLLDVMRKSPAQVAPDYCRRLCDLKVDTEGVEVAEYPVAVTVERTDTAHHGVQETVRARYVVGCDGARSSVRRALSLPLKGDSANKAWGVMDLLVVTDFPDIRIKSVIQSKAAGNLLIIPREGGHLVRIYVELDQLDEHERATSRGITCEQLIATAQRIFCPFEFEVKEVVWWSVYEIGQRLCDRFDNGSSRNAGNESPNVFIVGDACHTHSPKAGQGMNVSMHDSFNLGWKLAAVLRGQGAPELLTTYTTERRAVADELINFDRKLARMFSQPADSQSDQEGSGQTLLQEYMIKADGYVSGTQSRYGPSCIVAESAHQRLAVGFEVGKRFHSSPVVRLADARRLQLGHVLRADGRWRIVIFSNAQESAKLSPEMEGLVRFLDSPTSPLQKFTPPEDDIDSVIEVLAVFQRGYRDLETTSLPDVLCPTKGVHGLRDYGKVFCPDLDHADDVFDARGIDRRHGCMLVVRPDQHVAAVLPLDAFDSLCAFFEDVLRRQDGGGQSG